MQSPDDVHADTERPHERVARRFCLAMIISRSAEDQAKTRDPVRRFCVAEIPPVAVGASNDNVIAFWGPVGEICGCL